MSPRRRVDPDAGAAFAQQSPKPRRSVRLALLLVLAAVATTGAVVGSTVVLITHQRHHSAAVRDVAVTDFVRTFMTRYTSPDPFHANDYAQGVLDQATGQLAQLYKEKINEIVVQVARAEPAKGQVLEAGVERWNDDGSASVVVATKTVTTMPDGKQLEDAMRWVATATQEGSQWKISNLLQVI